jgi:hypothetical protein
MRIADSLVAAAADRRQRAACRGSRAWLTGTPDLGCALCGDDFFPDENGPLITRHDRRPAEEPQYDSRTGSHHKISDDIHDAACRAISPTQGAALAEPDVAGRPGRRPDHRLHSVTGNACHRALVTRTGCRRAPGRRRRQLLRAWRTLTAGKAGTAVARAGRSGGRADAVRLSDGRGTCCRGCPR